jgi:hypothetical protein
VPIFLRLGGHENVFGRLLEFLYQSDLPLFRIGLGLCWLLGKVIGAGLGGVICRFNFKDSVKIGVGMMARAEVLIVTAQTGVDSGLISDKIIPFTLILILSHPSLLRFSQGALQRRNDRGFARCGAGRFSSSEFASGATPAAARKCPREYQRRFFENK